MMRVRLPIGRSLFFLAALLFSLVALLPLRLAVEWLGLDGRGFAARDAQGSLWLGTFSEAQFGAVPLGDLTARLRTLPLFVGRARVDLEGLDGKDRFEGAVTVTRHSFGVDDVSGRVQVGSAVTPLPLSSVDLSDVTARFADGLCARADGTVKASVSGDVAGLPLASGLGGTARCDQGALLLPMRSQSGLEAVDLRLYGDGRFTAELGVQATNPALLDRLAAAGFTPVGDRHVMRIEGAP